MTTLKKCLAYVRSISKSLEKRRGNRASGVLEIAAFHSTVLGFEASAEHSNKGTLSVDQLDVFLVEPSSCPELSSKVPRVSGNLAQGALGLASPRLAWPCFLPSLHAGPQQDRGHMTSLAAPVVSSAKSRR